jgi:8-oxo-dGTP pyrophosphatase MutT (NUDIX family)
VLLQLRARWSHHGGTWSIPGGARERGESGVQTALREAREELGVKASALETRGSSVATCGGWTYETVLAVTRTKLRVRDLAESDGHAWVLPDEVEDLHLHPAFRTAWSSTPRLREFVTGSARAPRGG